MINTCFHKVWGLLCVLFQLTTDYQPSVLTLCCLCNVHCALYMCSFQCISIQTFVDNKECLLQEEGTVFHEQRYTAASNGQRLEVRLQQNMIASPEIYPCQRYVQSLRNLFPFLLCLAKCEQSNQGENLVRPVVGWLVDWLVGWLVRRLVSGEAVSWRTYSYRLSLYELAGFTSFKSISMSTCPHGDGKVPLVLMNARARGGTGRTMLEHHINSQQGFR